MVSIFIELPFSTVHIFGIEMSQRIHFLYQILLKMTIFLKNGKKKITFLIKKILGQPAKHNFEFKMLKLLEDRFFFPSFGILCQNLKNKALIQEI